MPNGLSQSKLVKAARLKDNLTWVNGRQKMKSLFFLVLTYLGADAAFLFSSGKIDCKVSFWSEWKGPVGFGEMERYRTVLAYPVNGGLPCPSLTETTLASRAPTVNETAKQLVNTFLRRTNTSTRFRRQTTLQTRDLLILMDASGSIGSSNFKTALNDLADLLGMLCAGNDNDPFKSKDIGFHQAAMIKFSTSITEQFYFGQRIPTSVLKNAIRSVTYDNGLTYTGEAFKEAIKMFRSTSKGVRNNPGVVKEVLILTDGQSNGMVNAITAAKELRDATFSSPNDKVNVFSLIIGNQTSAGQEEMKEYVSVPIGDHLFAVRDYDVLTTLVQEIKRQLSTYYQPCAPITSG